MKLDIYNLIAKSGIFVTIAKNKNRHVILDFRLLKNKQNQSAFCTSTEKRSTSVDNDNHLSQEVVQ